MIVVNEMEQVAYSEKKIEKSPWLPDDRPTAPKVKKSVFQVKKSSWYFETEKLVNCVAG